MPLTKNRCTLFSPSGDGIPIALLTEYADRLFAGGGASPFAPSVRYFNYAADRGLIRENARLTARGTLAAIGDLHAYAAMLVIGYGNVGEELALAARAAGYSVFVAARREAVREQIRRDGFEALPIGGVPRLSLPLLVCNTVPSPILSEDFFRRLPSMSRYYELASAPGGICPETDTAKIPIHTLSGVPGKYAPRDAAQIIFKTVSRYLGA